MLSSVLKSKRAIAVNIAIMRAFVRLRQILATHKDLAERLTTMEKTYDRQFKVVFDITESPKRQRGGSRMYVESVIRRAL